MGIFTGFLVVGVGYVGIIKLDTEIIEAARTTAGNSDAPARPTINFGFYDELANAEVEVSAPPPPKADTSGNVQGRPAVEQIAAVQANEDAVKYLLQAGSFQNRQDAENHRVKILLLNMEANIVPGIVSGRTWYRVLAGPFNGRSSAETAQAVLSESNIDSIRLLSR